MAASLPNVRSRLTSGQCSCRPNCLAFQPLLQNSRRAPLLCFSLAARQVNASSRQLLSAAAQHCKRASTRRLRCQCTADPSAKAGESSGNVGTVVGLALWAALTGYILFLSPNQTPYRDQYFILKQVGLGPDDGFHVNTVWVQLFNAMGLWPAIYASLLIPSGRSGNKVPAWPFVSLSFAFGVLALGPYFALWTPPPEQQGPPKKSELTGWGKRGQQYLESPVNGVLILAGTCAVLYQALTAGGAEWAAFLKMFDESRFEHATILDFSCLTLLAPFWLLQDAQQRQWDSRGPPLPIWLFAGIPLLGPALYLALRPRASEE
ncbi:hypothetical protein WJX73_006000 [Symbiochloris irregularis]|uniref:DUF2834 domain-containing protein n=1 Tax=Symbiochloris irregularis TaxID=706552 RepID=A0AAW1P156_9CHLO